MKKRYIGFAGLGLVLTLGTQQVHAQQGFGTDKPAKSAAVDIQSSKRGLLIPRVALEETTNGTSPIATPAKSLMVYNTATTNKDTATDVTPGYYYWDGTKWVRFAQQGDITAITLDGDVTGPTNATVVGKIQGVEVSNVNPTANQVLTFDATEGKWKPVSLTETSITSSTGITSTSITVGGGAHSTLKEVTLEIAPGTNGQVMITKEGKPTWVNQTEIVPTTTNELTKKDGTNGNTLVSTVNGVVSEANVIATVANTLTEGATLTTTVNGVPAAGLDLTPAIQAGQKMTTVADGVNTTVTSSVNPAGGNTTEYQVNVSDAAIQAAQKTTVVAAGAGVTVATPTVVDNVTTYTVSADASTIALAGDVTGNAGANTITSLQGSPVAAGGTKTAGQALVYDGEKWVPGTPKVDATDIKEAKNLTAAGTADTATIEVVSGGTNAVLVETSLRVKAESITSSEIKNGTILPEDLAKAGNNQVLVTDASGVPVWQNQAASENIYTHNGTLNSNRTVDFGTNTHLTFKNGDQSHDFTYDDVHTGLNMYGNEVSSIGLISNTNANGSQSELQLLHRTTGSIIKSNSTGGLKIAAENLKDITFSTSESDNGIDNVVFQSNGGVKVNNINTPAFKGGANDKVVVADGTGVLKTVERKNLAPQFFYMPAVIFDTKTTGTNLTRDLYQDYVNQFTTATGTAYDIAHGVGGGSLPYDGGVIGSTNAPAIATYQKGELYYYVTYYDKSVFKIHGIDADGKLKYDIIGNATPASYMNIVFVIK